MAVSISSLHGYDRTSQDYWAEDQTCKKIEKNLTGTDGGIGWSSPDLYQPYRAGQGKRINLQLIHDSQGIESSSF